jgi:ubiquinone/menaquinone biosynthesis C-methylase UbiE
MVAKYKRRTHELMHIDAGHRVLDVGCGPGTDTVVLAELVGETGQVVGVDINEKLIRQADQRAAEAGASDLVEHRLADAYELPFDSACFDSARSERVFQHLFAPHQALCEMVRVTKSGGWIVVLDTDWSTMSWDTELIDIEQRLKLFHAERGFRNAFAGRQLYRLFRRTGLTDIHVEMAPTFVTNYAIGRRGALLDETEQAALEAGIITLDELEMWHNSLEKADSEGVCFGSIQQMMIAGRKA